MELMGAREGALSLLSQICYFIFGEVQSLGSHKTVESCHRSNKLRFGTFGIDIFKNFPKK